MGQYADWVKAAALKTPNAQIDKIIRGLASDRYSGFMPDSQPYTASIEAQIADLLAQIPAGEEAFNADIASRGTFSAGEATKGLYSTVYAPIARAGASAIAQGNLGLEQARQQGYGMQQNARFQAVQLWLNKILTEQQIKAQKDAADSSAFGDILGAGIGLLAL